MRQGKRLTEAEHVEVRRRLAAGETYARASAAVGCSTKSIYRLLTGDRAPKRRTVPRAALRLSAVEREEISRGAGAAESCHTMAERLGRAVSTVARDIAGNGGRRHYRAWRAEAQAVQRTRRPKGAKLARCPALREAVERGLLLRWSPQQIAARLVVDYPDDPQMAGLARNDLPVLVRADPWRATARAGAVSPHGTRAPPAPAPDALAPRAHAGHGAHQGPPGRRDRSCRAGPLGRRPHHRQDRRLRHRHADRAAEPLRNAAQLARGPRRGAGADGAGRQDRGTPGATPALGDVGPRQPLGAAGQANATTMLTRYAHYLPAGTTTRSCPACLDECPRRRSRARDPDRPGARRAISKSRRFQACSAVACRLRPIWWSKSASIAVPMAWFRSISGWRN